MMAGLIAMVAPAHAAALERPAEAVFYGEHAGGAADGDKLYVIGDSISAGVPYLAAGESNGLAMWVRFQAGWSAYAHRTTKWCEPEPYCEAQTSVRAAAESDAHTVFVQLGTNDIRCMRPDEMCAGYDPPRTEAERHQERSLIAAETLAVAKTLVDAGKCVVWAGPREVAGDTWLAADAIAMNTWLRVLEDIFPGAFFYADYHRFSFANPAVLNSLDNSWMHPDADGVHPRSDEARAAIADFAVQSAINKCGAGGSG